MRSEPGTDQGGVVRLGCGASFRISGFRVQGSGSLLLGFRVQGSGFRILAFTFPSCIAITWGSGGSFRRKKI